MKVWALRIAHNVAVTHVRKESRARQDAGGTDEEPAGTPESALVEERNRAALRGAVAQLPALDQQLILLDLEGLPHSEIGEVTGLSTGAIATRLHRVRRSLIQQLSEGESR